MTDDQVTAVRQALALLAGLDADRAGLLNDVGFNRFDSDIGHKLATAERFTPKMAALGRRICRKYHRQIGPDLLARMGG